MTIEKIRELFKFSWAQAFSDHNGKSNISLVAFFLVTVAGCIGFLKSIFYKDGELTMWSVTTIGIGIGAFTGKKIVDGKVQPLGVTEGEANTSRATIAQVTTITATNQEGTANEGGAPQ